MNEFAIRQLVNCACLPGLPEGPSSAVMLRPLLFPLLSVLVLIGSPGLDLRAAEFTEGNAAAWGAFASDNAAVSVSDDATRVRVGARSIRFVTASGFDTGVQYPAAATAH